LVTASSLTPTPDAIFFRTASLDHDLERVDEQARFRENVSIEILVLSVADNSAVGVVEHLLPSRLRDVAEAVDRGRVMLEVDLEPFFGSFKASESGGWFTKFFVVWSSHQFVS